MKNNWPKVPLGDVLRKSERWIRTQSGETYKLVTVRLWGKGVILRGQVTGAEIAASEMLQVRPNQFILSRIDARNGAFGLIPDSLDGAIVSNDFPVFDIEATRLLPAFMRWMSKTRDFVDFCKAASEGTTNRVRLKEDRFLGTAIPLPPLGEQRRIVAKIVELAAKIEDAHFLRQKATEEAETVLSSEISYLFSKEKENGWNAGFLRDYVIDDCYGTSERASDDNSGTPIFRMGNIQSGRLDLRNLKYLHLNDKDRTKLLLEKGDILVNRTNSAELVGKCAVFDLEGEYGFASYLIRLRLDKNRAEPRLVASYINSPIGRAYMFSERKQMTGQANVNATKLKALPIVLPSLPEQCRIVVYLDGLQAKIEMLKQVGAQTSSELAALLPSILDKAFKGEL
jgi:type I restriction enzyme S subunit